MQEIKISSNLASQQMLSSTVWILNPDQQGLNSVQKIKISPIPLVSKCFPAPIELKIQFNGLDFKSRPARITGLT